MSQEHNNTANYEFDIDPETYKKYFEPSDGIDSDGFPRFNRVNVNISRFTVEDDALIFRFDVMDKSGGRLKVEYDARQPFDYLKRLCLYASPIGPAELPLDSRPDYLLKKVIYFVSSALREALADATLEVIGDAAEVTQVKCGGRPATKNVLPESDYMENRRKRFPGIKSVGRPPGPKIDPDDLGLIVATIRKMRLDGEKISKMAVGRRLMKDYYGRPDLWVSSVLNKAGANWENLKISSLTK